MSRGRRKEQKAVVERKRGDWADAEEPDEARFDGDVPTDEYAGHDENQSQLKDLRS